MVNQGYLLLVEDEPVVQANNKKILERRGYRISLAYTLAEARAFLIEKPPRAIVLDIRLPDGSGLDFLAELRQTSQVPVLMLTAMGTREDILRGFEAGGDDYLSKPYDLSVFLMRVEALLRRASRIPEALIAGPLMLEPASGKAYLNGVDMALPQREYALLQQFIQHPGKTLQTDYLFEKAWGHDMSGDSQRLRKTISRLRHKLEGSGYTIANDYNEGYVFELK